MSWELQVDIDLNDLGAGAALMSAFVDSIRPALASLEYREYRAGETRRDKPLTHELLDPDTKHQNIYHGLMIGLAGADRMVQLEACIEMDSVEPYLHPIYLNIFGPHHAGKSKYRRRSNAVISFGSRQGYRGEERTATGEVMDEEFVARTMTRICDQATPKSLYVIDEDEISTPLHYHLSFHNSHDGFRNDMREIAWLSLWGGHGFTDRRGQYPPLLAAEADTMLFARKSALHLSALKHALYQSRDLLEPLATGALTIPDELISAALHDTGTITPMATSRGIGILGTTFLRDPCEPFYLHILKNLRQYL